MTPRLVVIGGDAAGMSAASTAMKRCGDNLEVVAFERGQWTSYSACGIPYWIIWRRGGAGRPGGALRAGAPRQWHRRAARARGGGDRRWQRARSRVRSDGAEGTVGYDELMIATGAEPLRPDLPGIEVRRHLRRAGRSSTGSSVIDALRRGPRRAVVVGSGYIGVEMAEACLRHGLQTTLVDQAVSPMGLLDARPRCADPRRDDRDWASTYAMSTPVQGFASGDAGGGQRRSSPTARPFPPTSSSSGSVSGPGPISPPPPACRSASSGAIRADAEQRVDADRHVWAAGDCVESWHRLMRQARARAARYPRQQAGLDRRAQHLLGSARRSRSGGVPRHHRYRRDAGLQPRDRDHRAVGRGRPAEAGYDPEEVVHRVDDQGRRTSPAWRR
ncbi:MAG: FAD/NAD(P)-binding oxidoreductase [Nocardioidaceae bacterium]